MSKVVDKAVKKRLQAIQKKTIELNQSVVPIKTGALRRSLRFRRRRKSLTIQWVIWYADKVQFRSRILKELRNARLI